jgi:hypothetical protein
MVEGFILHRTGGVLAEEGPSRAPYSSTNDMPKAPDWPVLVPRNALRRNSNLILMGGTRGREAGGEVGTVSSFLATAGAAVGAAVFGGHIGGARIPIYTSLSAEVADAAIKARLGVMNSLR